MEHIFLPLIGGLVLYFILNILVKIPGRNLQSQFQSLGDMRGMSKSEIIQKCGNFKSIRHIEGGTVCVWMATGYVISLVFDANDEVVKIGSETAV
nr:hypothetical protein [uncultured Emticicia sp.]